jgi:hypothetical protein
VFKIETGTPVRRSLKTTSLSFAATIACL